MQVYKVFFKVIRKNLGLIIMYIVIFLGLAIALGNIATNPADIDFSETKVKVAFINNDKDSELIDGLQDYIDKNAEIVELEDTKESLQDALYFRTVEYIVRIPKGFTDGILKGEDVSIERTAMPNSTSEMYMDNLVNRYLNTAKIYISTMGDLSQKDIVSYVSKDLSEDAKVIVSTQSNDGGINEKRNYYYNYLAYPTFAILILGLSSVMIAFNNRDLRMRNLSSALTLSKMNFQMILGNITYGVFVWILMILASFVMYGSYMFTGNGLLYILNSFVFAIAALSISFLIGNLVKSRNAISPITNVVTLGACFISGVFVSQEFLGELTLTIASFNPTYWYIKANNEISVLVNFNQENVMPIFTSMLIIMGFAIATFAITLVVIKQKRLSH